MATRRASAAKRHIRYRLRVELRGVTPTIWRQVWVEGEMSLLQLHHILQAAMGWSDAHLHEFTIRGVHYATPHPEDDPTRLPIDERKVRLQDVLDPELKFEYQYDFGDDWAHKIQVELTESQAELQGAAHVEAGERACPPEDCGGSHGYQQFLDRQREDPHDEEVTSFLDWAGDDFDPDRFDRHAANAALMRMAWNRWGEK
jgi:hypothetical protein